LCRSSRHFNRYDLAAASWLSVSVISTAVLHPSALAIIFKIASALGCSTSVLMTETESQLAAARS
jgi:hypothetical protein